MTDHCTTDFAYDGQYSWSQSYAYQAGAYPQCFQRVIWTRRTLFFDSLDTQKFMSEFAEDDFSLKIEDVEAVVSLF